jgi:hypothetical protein
LVHQPSIGAFRGIYPDQCRRYVRWHAPFQGCLSVGRGQDAEFTACAVKPAGHATPNEIAPLDNDQKVPVNRHGIYWRRFKSSACRSVLTDTLI